jgi:glycine cleavage system H protein
MSHVPSDLRYTSSHEWVRQEGGVATCGVTDHAQELLGDVVFVELPAVGRKVQAGQEAGNIESVKAVSPIYAPVSGTVVAINEAIEGAPETVNRDPYGEGWLFRIQVEGEAAGLLSAAEYEPLSH